MKADRKNITMPSDWWEAFEAQAKADALPLSEWIGEQCLSALPRKVQSELSDRTRRGKPKKETE